MTTLSPAVHFSAQPRSRRIALLTGPLLLLVGLLADLWCIVHHLPYGLGGHGKPERVAQDWASHGTQLGPPMAPLVVLVLATPLATARRWWGGSGDVLLALVAVAMLVGTLGEPATHSGAVPLLFRIATCLTAAALLLSSIIDLGQRVRR